DALRVPEAIFEHYAGKPTSPLHLAKALNVDPKGSQLRVLTGAAIAFGMIDGGAQAATISVTDLARRIVKPTEEGTALMAQREAVLRPRIFGDFLRNYNGNPFPREDLAVNVLEEMGVPPSKTKEVLERILLSADQVGFIEEIRGKKYVTLQGASETSKRPQENGGDLPTDEAQPLPTGIVESRAVARPIAAIPPSTSLARAIVDDERRHRVFITHGKNRDLVDTIRKLLE